MRRRSARTTAAAIALAAVLVPTIAAAAGTWNIVSSPNGSAATSNALQSTAAISSSDIWAAGYYNTGTANQTLTEHYNGASWAAVTSANTGAAQNNQLYSVAAASTNDVWAVGSYHNGTKDQTLIEHWNGSAWAVVTSPNTGAAQDNVLRAVSVVSSSDVWAVGYAGAVHQTLTEHWNGAGWSVVASPSTGGSNELYGVAAASTTDVWAVGNEDSLGINLTLTLHYNGVSWSIVGSAHLSGNYYEYLQSVTAVSSSDVWAVGMAVKHNNTIYQTLTEHWNGASWTVVGSPVTSASQSNFLTGVAATSTGNVWAVGYVTVGVFGNQTLTEDWDGSSWSIVSSADTSATQSNSLYGVAAISAGNLWAVGSYTNGASQTLIERYTGTSWSIVASPNATSGDQLRSVATVTPSDVWAVGFSLTASGAHQTLTEHWDGSTWSVVASPNVAPAQESLLAGVAAVSTSDVYAVGNSLSAGGYEQTLIEHWNGTAWSIVASPDSSATQDNVLTSVTAISTSDVWGVGYYANAGTNQTLIEHWNGAAWTIVASPNTGPAQANVLHSVSQVGSGDVWAVGAYDNAGTSQTLTEHWNGAAWSIVASANTSPAQSNFLVSASAVSTSDVWTVGYYSSGGISQTLTEHWDGSAWSIVASPNTSAAQNNLLEAVSAVSASDVWATGYDVGGSTAQTLAEHWDGSAWTIATSANTNASVDNQLFAIAMLSTSSGWAVGNSGASATLVEDYVSAGCNGGALALPDPGAQNFAPLTLTGVDQTASTVVTLQPSDLTGSGSGWNVQVTASQFSSGPHALPASATSVTAAGAAASMAGTCSLPSNSVTYPVTLGTLPVKIYDAAAGSGAGPANVPFVFTLGVPANTYAGSYTSTWVFSIASGP